MMKRPVFLTNVSQMPREQLADITPQLYTETEVLKDRERELMKYEQKHKL